MRADRLLLLLLLLQAQGKMTALALSQTLAVSERTIYRDIEALSLAGVPVYAERGPGGGIGLVDSYRTTLTGLKQDEIRALLMLDIPASLQALGVGQALQTALLKLTAAVSHQDVKQRILLDSIGWFEHETPVGALRTLHQAVWNDRKVTITYQLPFETQVTRLVDPYSLVAKMNVWYLVLAREDFMRVLKVADILFAEIARETFERSPEFDLASFWAKHREDIENNRPQFRVKVSIDPRLLPFVQPFVLGEVAKGEGWIPLTLGFENFESARTHLLGWGRAVEILEPIPLLQSVLDFAKQIVDFYS